MGVINNFKNLGSVQKMSSTKGYNANVAKRYDEPTYISFKLSFGISDNILYNDVSDSTSFDFLPHPLFQKPNGNTDEYLYSAVTYLRNINEPLRANMLLEFIDMFNIIQYDYQWYFQEVNGIDTLLNVDTMRGKRLPKDATLEIKCLDSLDRRMYYLFSLYRKIAWDDTYQRWLLPDMMRFFTLTIYITEFRHFHRPFNVGTNSYVENVTEYSTEEKGVKNLIKSVVSDIKDAGKKFMQDTFRTYSQNLSNFAPIVLDLMDNEFPTHVIKCEMCEFDISSFTCGQYNNISLANMPDMCDFSFKVKVGKVSEKSNYPLFSRQLDDFTINGSERTRDESTIIMSDNVKAIANIENNVGSDVSSVPISKRIHATGEYYHQAQSITDDPLNTSHTKAWINRNMYLNNTNVINRMINNATTFGVAKIENAISDTVDSLKMHDITPGVNFNSIQGMISSGDIISSLGMLRRAIEGTYESNMNPAPSSELDKMTDDAFKALLGEYTKATVSLHEEPLQNAAKKALIDSAYYEQVKDASKATDMVGLGEINTFPSHITKDALAGNYNTSIKASATSNNIDGAMGMIQKETDYSKATDMIGDGEENTYSSNLIKNELYKEIKAIPISKATNGAIIFEGKPSS